MNQSDPILRTSNTSLSAKEGDYPSPFLDIASFMLPSSLKETLDLCTMFWLKHGTYSQAAKRIVRYFITEPEFTQGETNRKELMDFLNLTFDINQKAAAVGDDLLSCGLSASSVIFPFNRFLRCPQCHREYFIDSIYWDYNDKGFSAKCQNQACSHNGTFAVVDRKSFDRDRVTMHRWNPYDLHIQQHPYTKRTILHWDIPTDIRAKIKARDKFMIRDMPVEMLKTIADNKVFQFSPSFVHYAAEETLATVDLKGWGLPRLMSNFSQAYYVQMIKRANEAMAQDYMVPFRLLSPAALPSDSQNPWAGSVDSELVNNSMRTMIDNHRLNPTSWNFSPVPMQYQGFSGEGNNMATPELLQQGINELLAATGIPPELYTGSVSVQAAPMALRVLQQSWPTMISFLNTWLEFVVWSTTKYMNWEYPSAVSFKKVTQADDLERRQLLLQLASANMVSKRTAYSVWGIDPKEEQQQIINEMRDEQEAQTAFQEEMAEQAEITGVLASSGQVPVDAAGNPASASGLTGMPVPGAAATTVTDRAQQVDELAQQLVRMPYEARRTELKNIKDSDEELHALVKAKMETIRGQARSQGSQALSQGQI